MVSSLLPLDFLVAISHRGESSYVFLIPVPLSALGQETVCHGGHRFCAGSVEDLHRGSVGAGWLSPVGNHNRSMARPLPDPWLVSDKSICLREYGTQAVP